MVWVSVLPRCYRISSEYGSQPVQKSTPILKQEHPERTCAQIMFCNCYFRDFPSAEKPRGQAIWGLPAASGWPSFVLWCCQVQGWEEKPQKCLSPLPGSQCEWWGGRAGASQPCQRKSGRRKLPEPALSAQESFNNLDISSERPARGGCPRQICEAGKRSQFSEKTFSFSHPHSLSSPATEMWGKLEIKLSWEIFCLDWRVDNYLSINYSIINLYMKLSNICLFILLDSS